MFSQSAGQYYVEPHIFVQSVGLDAVESVIYLDSTSTKCGTVDSENNYELGKLAKHLRCPPLPMPPPHFQSSWHLPDISVPHQVFGKIPSHLAKERVRHQMEVSNTWNNWSSARKHMDWNKPNRPSDGRSNMLGCRVTCCQNSCFTETWSVEYLWNVNLRDV